MDRRPIGVFDSGLGGLTAAKELMSLMPEEDIIYFGDTGRVPYGSRSDRIITRYAFQDVAFLASRGVKAVVCACGTVSSVAGPQLAKTMDCPFFEVVMPSAKAACAATKTGRVGVIATRATIQSGKFPAAIQEILPQAQVFGRPCPLFVPLVEEGHIAPEDPLATAAVELYLAGLREENIDTLILGCTHYPLLAPLIGRFLGEGVTLINSGREAALTVREALLAQGLAAPQGPGGTRQFFITDQAGGFGRVAAIFLGSSVQNQVTQVDLSLLEGFPVPQGL